MQESDYFEMNRVGWDKRAAAHFDSSFYDLPGFLAGQTSLREIELAELDDVSGQSLLHLQCHFGMDTLSWARMGAICTGVDISPVAIHKAKALAQTLTLDAEFVCTDVYSFQRSGASPYDIVFTSYGAICWLPDLKRWADITTVSTAWLSGNRAAFILTTRETMFRLSTASPGGKSYSIQQRAQGFFGRVVLGG